MRPYSRHEFSRWLNLRDRRLGGKNCAAWSGEPKGQPSQWFVNVRPINVSRTSESKADYWAWCRQNLQGQLLCYYCDSLNGIEWWGFTHKDDIMLWMLKWA